MRLRNAWILAGAILLFGLGANAAPPDGDNDGVPNNRDNCPLLSNPAQDDDDADGVGDICDNCILVGNLGQEDADRDGYGNACDADLDQNGWVGINDFTIFTNCAAPPGEAATPDCRHCDFDSDNRVNSIDYQMMEEMWDKPPGPSGVVP